MREAARALDDVSDHLGEVLRRADELLVEWSQFGTQVRAQVERQVAAIGDVVDDAVARAASAGIDRAIADRLRGLTTELERLEQRARAASRAVVEQRDRDRRVLWVLVGGVVLANALLVALLLRKPDPAPVAEPIRLESTASPSTSPRVEPPNAAPVTGSSEAASAANAAHGFVPEPQPASAGSNAAGATSPTAGANVGSTGPSVSPSAGTTGGASPGAGAGASPKASGPHAGSKPAEAVPVRLTPSPIALPPKARGHKKQP